MENEKILKMVAERVGACPRFDATKGVAGIIDSAVKWVRWSERSRNYEAVKADFERISEKATTPPPASDEKPRPNLEQL